MKRFILLVLFHAVFFDAYCQTAVSGDISGVWSKNHSPYLVNGDLNVLSNSSLMIEPGVKVVFQGYFKFNIEGQLIALGSKNDSIIFTVNDTTGFHNSNEPSGAWNGIKLNQKIKRSININCCVFEFAKQITNGIGGAIEITDIYDDFEITNCAFKNNIGINGGAIYYSGFGKASGNISIKNCSFTNNHARNGGAIHVSSFGNVKEFFNNTFINNKATDNGGAIVIQASNIYNCLFKNNHAGLNGGAVWNGVSTSLNIYNSIFDNNSAAKGGAYYADMGVFAGLYNCTIINNTSAHSSIFLGHSSVFDFTIKNTIVWNPNSPEVMFSSNQTNKIIENSLIRNAKDSSWFSATCLDINPLLSDTELLKYYPTELSPGVDKGNNEYINPNIPVDFNNKCRIWDGKNSGSKTVDIGAIEFNSVDSLPKIKNNLNNTTLCEGSELSLQLSVLDNEKDHSFEWFRNYGRLNTSGSNYIVDHSTLGDSGYYFCRIKNKFGEIQSEIVEIIVSNQPEKPLKPFGVIDSISSLIDTSIYVIPKIKDSEMIEWELLPVEAGTITFNDTLAVIKWNKSFEGESYLFVKHSNENCFSVSDTLKLVVERALSYKQEFKLGEHFIYPNPSSGNFFVDLSRTQEKATDLIIIDNFGKVLRKDSFQNSELLMEYNMPHGIYIVVVMTRDKKVYADKIVIF